MLCHMTVLRCLKIYQYESVEARRIIQRDADVDESYATRSSLLADRQTQHEVEVQFDQIVELIRAGLAAEHPTQGIGLVRVFNGMLAYETISEIAAALKMSERTVNRRVLSVRAYVAEQIEELGLDLDFDFSPE